VRIVQIVTQMEPAGAQKVAHTLHQAFRERGHDAELWFLYLKRAAYLGSPGVQVLWHHPPSKPDYVRIAARLLGWLRSRKPDVVLSHTHYANVMGQVAAAVAGIRSRVAVHHGIIRAYPGFARCLDHILGALGLYTSQIAVSRAVIESMAGYPKAYTQSVRCIYNGVPIELCGGNDRKARDVRGPHQILHVGRFAKEKNHSVLLRALLHMPNASLTLVGDGELRSQIEAEARVLGLTNRVVFAGEIPHPQVQALMRSCDLFMFPSRCEAMPMAVLEAMAAAMPIVASDIPAHREFLQGAGLLVSPDPSGFAEAGTKLLTNPDLSLELGKRAAERARSFSTEFMVSQYEQLLLQTQWSCLQHQQQPA